jgi:ACS family hexuronate transporter-like MFS transporter
VLWLPGFFIRRGWSGLRARLATMALFAAGFPISALGVVAKDLWTAVAFISIATAYHQAWSANMFTVASDAFPSRAVGSVVGFGGMCGGMLMLLVAGGMLQWLGNFTPLFIFAGVMHPLAWIAIRALVGKNITQIDLDKGLRTAQSPALLAMGLGLVAVGATLAALVFANWSYILSVTKNSVAAAGGAAAASLLALMGLALVYASREVRLGAARSAA